MSKVTIVAEFAQGASWPDFVSPGLRGELEHESEPWPPLGGRRGWKRWGVTGPEDVIRRVWQCAELNPTLVRAPSVFTEEGDEITPEWLF